MPFPFMAAAMLGGAGIGALGSHFTNRSNERMAANQIAFQQQSNEAAMAHNTASAREAMNFARQSADAQMAHQTISQYRAQDWNHATNQLQQQFQERMSNTAYQRAVADMKAAGLNPVLAANSPSSTPSGASGSISPTSGASASGTSSSGVSSSGATGFAKTNTLGALASGAMDLLRMSADIDEIQSRTDLNRSSITSNETSAKKMKAETELTKNKGVKEAIERRAYEAVNSAVNTLQQKVRSTAKARPATSAPKKQFGVYD